MPHFDARDGDGAAIVDGVVYRPLWQTWSLVTRRANDAAAPAATRAPKDASTSDALREQVQIARIDRRLSIVELAASVQCDAEQLAAFERGDEVLHADVQRRLRRALGV